MIPSASPACRAPTATPCAESARLRRHDRPASVTATTMHTDSCDDRGRHPTEHRWHAGGKGIGRMSVTPNEYPARPTSSPLPANSSVAKAVALSASGGCSTR
jgi:hypothetical protein